MKKMYVYILECNDESFYVGVTNDINSRMSEHNEGIDGKAYTFSRRPVKLVYCRIFFDPEEAIGFEKQLKGWSRAKKLALIANNILELKKLSECRNNTSHKNLKN